MASLKKETLKQAVKLHLLHPEQVDPLWQFLKSSPNQAFRLDLVQILYYAGALVIIAAMGWLFTDAWEKSGGKEIFTLSSIYAVIFAFVGNRLWVRPQLKIAGGLLIVVAVCMTPLIVYSLQKWLDLWIFGNPGQYRNFYQWIKGGWFAMEIATLLSGIIALFFCRFTFLTAHLAFTLWFMSMDLTPLLFTDSPPLEAYQYVSIWCGLIMLLGAYFIDHLLKFDYAFWIYLLGMLAFWGGLNMLHSDSELSKFIYFLINLTLIGFSLFLRRIVFLVFGSIGIFIYLGHLGFLFKGSFSFPIILTFIGLLIMFLGIQLSYHHRKIEQWVEQNFPKKLLKLRPKEKEHPLLK